MKRWIQFTVNVEGLPDHVMEVIALIISEQCNGVEFITERNETTGIRGYVQFGDDGRLLLDEVQHEITQCLQSNNTDALTPQQRFALETIEDVDWATAWKEYYKPTKVGEHFVIIPSWESHKNLNPDDKIITLDPGQAFGTGHHASTRLCMRLMENFDLQDKRVADIGCGSGILSIAAVLLGSEKVFACDIDEGAVRIAKENGRKNSVFSQINFLHGSASDLELEPPFDLVIANMLFDILHRISQDLVKIVRNGGDLIWSGIIDKQAVQVESLCKRLNLEVVRTQQESEWMGYLLRKN